jgi:hypothetical protein
MDERDSQTINSGLPLRRANSIQVTRDIHPVSPSVNAGGSSVINRLLDSATENTAAVARIFCR